MTEKLEVFYVRHGNTDGTLNGDRHPCDVDLSPLGEKQILLLGERFSGKTFDAVFTSPLVRCVKTAAAVCKRLDCPPVLEVFSQLTENGTPRGYFGESAEYLSRFYGDIKINNDLPLMFDNSTDEDNDRRARAMLDYIKNRFTYGQKILVVAHGSYGNHFLPQSVGINMHDAIFSVENTSVSKIKYTNDGKMRISFMNDISHLRPLMPEYEFTE